VGASVAGGTFAATVKCPQCSAQRATVHTVLSGGTYAQVGGSLLLVPVGPWVKGAG
jgi:hypothetical protein